MRYQDHEMQKYIHYLKKNGRYSKEFMAENDTQAKLITHRIHGKNPSEYVALFRIGGHLTVPGENGHSRRLKGIQL